MSLKINNAEYLGNYKIKLVFSDNKTNIVDFEQFLLNSRNPMTKKYLDEEFFLIFIWNTVI